MTAASVAEARIRGEVPLADESMGFGKHIILTCECGFRTERAMVGHLLAHESLNGAFTILEATYDPVNQRIVTHATCLPSEFESLLDSDPTPADEAKVNQWLDLQREELRKANGPLLEVSEDDQRTDFVCPNCKSSHLILRTDGNWIA